MKKRLLSVFAAAAVLTGSVCSTSAATEEKNGITLSPRASIEIADGKVEGITGLITADWLRAQFENDVKVLSHHTLENLEGDTIVPSMTTVTTSDESDSVTIIIPGDVSIDGKIDLLDVTAILKHIAKWSLSCCEFNLESADFDGDGAANLADVTTLLKYIAKWDVNIFDEVPTLTIFKEGVPQYKLLVNDPDTDDKIASAIKNLTGNDIEIVTEVSDEDNFIVVGKDLYNSYPEIIDADAVKAVESTRGYIDTYDGDVYLTANSDKGILGCINYITNQAFTPELDMEIKKGTVGELGDLETLIHPLYTTIEIEGLKSSHRLLHVTDSHLTTVYEDEETAERRANVYSRLNDWMLNMYRKPSYLYFNEYFNYAENIGAEGIMLTGDITDSPSKSNRDILEAAIDGCSVPTYYVYGNHDWSWNDNAATGDKYHSLEYRVQYKAGFAKAVDAYNADWDEYVNAIDKGEYVILSIDNSDYGFPTFRPVYNTVKEAIDNAKAAGKPVIVMLHIPLHTDEMHENLLAIKNGGDGYCIKPEASQYNTLIYNLIVAEDSPVAAIFCGHVHDNYETLVEGRIPQYLTGAALEGWCRVIDLVPAK